MEVEGAKEVEEVKDGWIWSISQHGRQTYKGNLQRRPGGYPVGDCHSCASGASVVPPTVIDAVGRRNLPMRTPLFQLIQIR
jgi:hypothetical protein